MKAKLLPFFFSFIVSVNLKAQSLYEVSLNEKVSSSTLIIEGKVVDQQSFWNRQHTIIYTSNSIEVYKIFKGTVNTSTVKIVTIGGRVGEIGLVASDAARLSRNDIGTFFLRRTNSSRAAINAIDSWEVYSSAQGFIKYDLRTGTANAPFAHYKNISKEFYRAITSQTNKNIENRKPGFAIPVKAASNARELSPLATPVISGFSPLLVTAGTFLDPANNVLTINGSGFGVGGGTAAVYFDDPDDGIGNNFIGVSYDDPLVISWSDTQIKIRVPGEAGTGQVYVEEATGNYSAAPGTLDVLYSVQNYNGKETSLINANGSGGYTISYSTNTAGSALDFDAGAAKQTFERALATWKESAGANITVGAPTTIQTVAFDGVNTIMYDNQNTGTGGPLAAGVLAVCYSWYADCGTNPTVNQARKVEFEIVVRNAGFSTGSASFTLGPCPPNSSNFLNIDLETVILHELGHALNLGHVNDDMQGNTAGRMNPGKLMNWTVANSVRRTSPDYAALAGALYVITPQGSVTGSCLSSGEMTALTPISEPRDNCPASFPVTATAPGTVVAFDLVHASSNRFVDPAYTQVRCDGLGTSITNNAYYAFKTNPAGGILSLAVSGYNTTPAAIASCPQIYGSIPVSGIRLSLYQANACPSAGAFPSPVSCQTFSGNGTLANITGLAANTNYLIFLEGIENTKASFSLTFAGSVLPIKFERFTGTAMENMNRLNWSVSNFDGVKSLVLEKSENGKDYYAVDSIQRSAITSVGLYYDTKPLAGHNYYRLSIANADGSKQYSPVVLLERSDKFLASVYPNPASNSINLEISTIKAGFYSFDIYNGSGQLVQQERFSALSSKQIFTLPLLNLANGMYFLKITNDRNETLKNVSFTINR